MQLEPEHEHHGSDSEGPASSLRVPERIPLFALPNVVFFPKTYLPLHIFEPRYRQMVTDAAVRGQCIGMVLLKEGWEEDYYGNPPIFPLGCVGRLVSVQKLQDGRSNILLQGVERFEITQEVADKSYREADILLKPHAPESVLAPVLRTHLLEVLEEYLRTREEAPSWEGAFRGNISDDILVHTLSTYLDCTPLEKQFLLEADSLYQQARRLSDLLHFKMHERHGAKGLG
jgi:Lon protease-like protein